MPSHDRRAAHRRAWGRSPIILRFEPLEGRQLLSAAQRLPDLVASGFDTVHNLDWGDSFHAVGQISNQGLGTAQAPFLVDIYASPTPRIGPAAVKLGEATIPAGLAPGQTSQFDQVVSLPSSPLHGTDSSQTVYIELLVNPTGAVIESNTRDNQGLGQGYDTSVVTITPHQPSQLVGTSLGIDSTQVSWGNTINITAQIQNNAPGDAPPTRARFLLTPAGATPGGPADVTVGSIAVPAIPAWQTVNVVHPITLPATPPTALAGSTQFTLTMVQDADFVTNPLYPPPLVQGLGRDQALLRINPGPVLNTPQPNLAAATVLAPSAPLTWGQNFQVATSVQNVGQGDAGPFLVQFLLVGASGTLDHALVLGATSIPGLKAGSNQDIVETLKLPNRLPAGLTLNSTGVGRIAVMVDPEHTVNEPFQNNKISESAPVVLRVLGTDGTSTVPTLPPAAAVPTQPSKLAPPPQRAPAPRGRGKIHRKAPPPQHHSVGYQIERKLKIFPRNIEHWFKGVFN